MDLPQLDPIETLTALLREAKLQHLDESLKANGATLKSLNEKCAEGRTPFLSFLKSGAGVEALKDRQALANAFAKASKADRIKPAADETQADAAADAAATEAASGSGSKAAFVAPTLADLPTLSRPPHIVCLHGGGACAAVLKVQLARLLTQLGPLNADVSYIEGGRTTEFDGAMIAQIMAATGVQATDLRDWFITKGNHYNEFSFEGFDEAIDHAERMLHQLIDTKQRPVDILLGFSQGADMAILLAARHLAGKTKTLLPSMRGLVLLETDHPFENCGWAKSMRDELFKEPLSIPALVVGATRTVHPRKGSADAVEKMFAGAKRCDFADVHRPLPQDRKEADETSATIVRFVWEACSGGGGEAAKAVEVS